MAVPPRRDYRSTLVRVSGSLVFFFDPARHRRESRDHRFDQSPRARWRHRFCDRSARALCRDRSNRALRVFLWHGFVLDGFVRQNLLGHPRVCLRSDFDRAYGRIASGLLGAALS